MSKASKMRDCPALGRGISSADCGEQRQSVLACPAECVHNPFKPDHYAQLLDLENRVDKKSMEQVAGMVPDPAAFARELAKANRGGLVTTQTFYVWNLFLGAGADGLTIAQRWERAGWPDLKNDERVLMRAKMQTRAALVEIHRIRPDGLMEAVDLFSKEPAPLILQDRSTAAQASRFSTLLTWMYPLPHYWRISGVGVTIPDVAQMPAVETVRAVVKHLGGPLTEAEMRHWLAEHYPRVSEALLAVSHARHALMLAGMDAKWGAAGYELRSSFAQCRQRLEEVAAIDFDKLSEAERNEGFAEARAWFDGPPKSKRQTAAGGQMLLGRILLGQAVWRLETMGAEKLSRLRSLFESHMGDRVRFTSERVDDLGGRMAAKGREWDTALVPPSLLENPSRMILSSSRIPAPPQNVSREEAERLINAAADKAFLEEGVPALDNHTPREAATSPELRPRLVQLMKQRVRLMDERNLETGGTDDLNWMLRELGLTELIFDPPPWRPPLPKAPYEPRETPEIGGMPELEDFSDEPIVVDPHRLPAPPLPAEPFDAAEAEDRLRVALEQFATAREAEVELLTSGSNLINEADELTLELLSEQDFSFAISFLLQVWFAFVPVGFRAPELDADGLERAFNANARQLEVATKAATAKKMEKFLMSGRQPELMMVLAGNVLHAAHTAPAEIRPSVASQPVILALLKAVVDELDGALRSQS